MNTDAPTPPNAATEPVTVHCPNCGSTGGNCPVCEGWAKPVVVNDEPPPPESEDAMIERKALLFLLVQLSEILSNINRCLVDVLLFGPFDDGEGPATYWQKLEAAWTRLEALKQSLAGLGGAGYEITIFEDQIKVEMERIRQTYQQSSNRGVLKLPVWVVKE